MGTFLTKFRSSFQKVPFIINALFPPLQEILYAGCIKLFTEASEHLKLTLFQLTSPQNGVLRLHPSGAQNC